MPTLEELIVSLPFPEDPQLSPDGTHVAYVATPYGRVKDAEGAIWMASVDSGDARQFTSGNGRDEQPRWSPDGQWLGFLSERAEPGRRDLYRIPREGGEAEPLVQRKRGIERFAWSPDGGTIAFLCPDDPDDEDERREKERDDAEVYGERWPLNRLRLLDLASRETRTLATGDLHLTELVWSPDGRRIAYVARPTPELESGTQSRMCVIAVDGESEPTELPVTGGYTPRDLCWTCGRRVAPLRGRSRSAAAGLVHRLHASRPTAPAKRGWSDRAVTTSAASPACARCPGASASPCWWPKD